MLEAAGLNTTKDVTLLQRGEANNCKMLERAGACKSPSADG